jgi:hypothetical protein
MTMPIHEKMMAGLKAWGKTRKTHQIEESLSDKEVDDPRALAVWIRKQSLGPAEFKRHQDAARKK